MLRCPHCHVPLTRRRGERGMHYSCDRCHGRALTLPLLRRRAGEDLVRALWRAAQRSAPALAACPGCSSAMHAVPAHDLEVDVCTKCQLVWLDRLEADALPPAPAHERFDDAPAAQLRHRGRRSSWHDTTRGRPAPRLDLGDLDDASLAEAFGLSDGDVPRPLAHWPWLTWGVAGAVVIGSAALGLGSDAALERWGLLPELAAHEPWRLVSTVFVHDNAFALMGSVLIVLALGDNLERAFGRWNQATLLLAGTVAGNVLAAVLARDAATPQAGATALAGTVLGAWGMGQASIVLGRHPADRRGAAALVGLVLAATAVWCALVFSESLLRRRSRTWWADPPFHSPHASLVALLAGAVAGFALAWWWSKAALRGGRAGPEPA